MYKFYTIFGVCRYAVFADSKEEAKEKFNKINYRKEKFLICKKA